MRFLEQILNILKHSRYVSSLKGQKGGYRLAKPPSKITLAEIVRLIDGALAPTLSVSQYFYGHTPIEKEEKVISIFRKIRDFASDLLEKSTLQDLI